MFKNFDRVNSTETLAYELESEVQKAGFESPFKISKMSTAQEYLLVNQKFGCDYRAKPLETEQEGVLIAPTFRGVAFDPNRLRSQTFVITNNQLTDFHLVGNDKEVVITLPKSIQERGLTYQDYGYDDFQVKHEQDSAIGIMSIVIAPERYIANEKYFKSDHDKLRLVSFQEAHGLSETPAYLVIPAWTIVEPQYRTRFAIPGFRAYKRMLDVIAENAPVNTYIEASAAGKIEGANRRQLFELRELPIGTEFDQEYFPYDFSLLGENSPGSSSSVKLAGMLNLEKSENIGSSRSLGPVFLRKLN
jgi:hypothetical protein